MIITTSKPMRARDVADLYPTPRAACAAALDFLPGTVAPTRILDPGAGSGPWGDAARERWPSAFLSGVELRPVDAPASYNTWEHASFIPLPTPKPPIPTGDAAKDARRHEQYEFDRWASEQPVWSPPDQPFDLVVGNPPYKYAEAFALRALSFTRIGGAVVFLLRLAFLEGRDRGTFFWKQHAPHTVAVCSRRPSFTGDSKTDATAYAIFIWLKGYDGQPRLTWMDWQDAAAQQLSLEAA